MFSTFHKPDDQPGRHGLAGQRHLTEPIRTTVTGWDVTKIRSVGCAMAASGLVPLEPEVDKLRGQAEPSLPAPPPPRRATWGRRSGKRKRERMGLLADRPHSPAAQGRWGLHPSLS